MALWNGFRSWILGERATCRPVAMLPSLPLPRTFVHMTNPHNNAFHKVMIWQEKDKCKHYTDKHWEEKHLAVHCLLPVERVWELGDFNSWTGLILETTSHLYWKEKHIFITLHSSIEGRCGHLPRPLWEQKGLNWKHREVFPSLFILSLPGHTFPFMTLRS